ncbi:MAG TPA: nicotinamide riboside transporter PnuC [Thermoanaerobaculia bacterium]
MTRAARRRLALATIAAGTAALALVSPWTEALGASTGAVCVWLAAVSDPWTWPIGIANNLLYLVVFWRSRLYADALLQLVYVGISIYGIWRWRGGGGGRVRPVGRGSRGELTIVACAVAVAAVALWRLLAAVTDSDVPAWDGLTTAMSLGAQWLMSRRVLENWWLWIAVDLVYVPLYLYKGLLVTAGLYALFLALCGLGLRDWNRELAAGADGRLLDNP